jgi:RNA polymerase sigma-70 factor (ECF subfamily)
MVDAGPWTVTDEQSLIACYDQSVRAVYRAASRLTGGDRAATDDLVQDVYVSLVDKARSGAVTEVGMGWLVTSTRHRYLDRLRGQQRDERRLRLVWSAAESSPDGAERPDLSDMPDRERAALVLHYIDDLPVAEVARLMGTSVHATESLLARARRRVRAREVRDA